MTVIDFPLEQKLLTIAIPTFNRSKFLNILLESIYIQLIGKFYSVEVIVYDNNSDDSTSLVVLDWKIKGLPVIYKKNNFNVGSDRNIMKAFLNSLSRYVWVVGDDDVLLPNSIESIISIVNCENPALIYLNCHAFSGSFSFRDKEISKVSYITLTKENFLKKTNINLTFITAVVINREAFFKAGFGKNLDDLYDTNLVQLGWVLPSIYLDMPLVYVSTQIVAGRNENRGGYGQFDIFVNNFNKILLNCYKNSPAWSSLIRNVAIRQYYPSLLVMLDGGSWGVFDEENYEKILIDNFKGNFRYWIFLYPLLRLPVFLRGNYLFIIRVVNFILRFVDYFKIKLFSKIIRF